MRERIKEFIESRTPEEIQRLIEIIDERIYAARKAKQFEELR